MSNPIFKPRGGADGLAAAYLAWRLEKKVEVQPSGCWEWPGGSNGKGYGHIDMKNWDWPERTVSLHRLVYMLCVGPVNEGQCVLHTCDNPSCIRPDHLFIGTNLDNINDKVSKGRQARGQSVRGNHDHLKGETVATARYNAEQVMEMRRRDAAGESPAAICADFGLSDVHLNYILTGKAWAHLPLLYSGDRKNRPCPKCNMVFTTRAGIFYKHVEKCGLILGEDNV